jgi:hypothetical protein
LFYVWLLGVGQLQRPPLVVVWGLQWQHAYAQAPSSGSGSSTGCCGGGLPCFAVGAAALLWQGLEAAGAALLACLLWLWLQKLQWQDSLVLRALHFATLQQQWQLRQDQSGFATAQ